MKVEEDSNIIALAKVIKEDELEESPEENKKNDSRGPGQMEMKTE